MTAQRTAAIPAMLGMLSTALLFLPAMAFAEILQGETIQAWNRYLAWADGRVQKELEDPAGFLIEDFLPLAEKQAIKQEVMSGAVLVRRMGNIVPEGAGFSVPNGEIHHWWGSVLVPDVKLPELLRFLKDYDHHAGRFSDVEQSRLLSHKDNEYRFFFRLRRSKAIVTAYYSTEQECLYTDHGPLRTSSRSNAVKIAELENPGTPAERERPPGDDRGFLWRLVSWWRFQQVPQGTIVECESASLSRDIPPYVRWIPGVSSYIRSTPRESLESVLLSIRNSVRPR